MTEFSMESAGMAQKPEGLAQTHTAGFGIVPDMKLKPCPFCGADEEEEVDQSIVRLNHKDKCPCFDHNVEMQDPEEVELWNTRV